jgi:chemotaxis protein MotB
MSGHGGGGKKKKRGGHGGGGGGGGHGGDSRWLVTYADLLTVLMALFLVLWTLSTIDLNKFKKFTQGLGDFGNPAAQQVEKIADASPGAATDQPTDSTVEGTTTTVDPNQSDPPVDAAGTGTGEGTGPELTATELADIAGKLQSDFIDHNIPATDGAVRLEDRGLVVSVQTDGVLFTSGSAAMTDSGRAILAAIAPDLANIGNQIFVEGHTDSRPVAGRPGYDNWNLSADRALAVLKMLNVEFGFAPTRLRATGYADQRPVDPGTSPDALARNRRVEIVVVAAARKPTPATTEPSATEGAADATTADGSTAAATNSATGDSTATTNATTKPAAKANATPATTPPSSDSPATTSGSEG